MNRLLTFVLSACVTAASAHAEMECATPESQGVDSAAISRWIDACETAATVTNGLKGFLHGFVIVRHGRIIAEGSWAPQKTLEVPHVLYSHSKSFTSTAIGFLVDDGKLDLDARLVDLLPESIPTNAPERVSRIRVRDLLTMNTGSTTNHQFRRAGLGNWARRFGERVFDYEPGTHFTYDSDATYLLAAIAEKLSGRKLMDFLRVRLFSKIGIEKAWSTVSPEGIACGGWGMYMTTRELARFGQFCLNRGMWNGERLLSHEWVDLATARQTWCNGITIASQAIGSGSDWNQGYGFQFWRCQPDAVYRADGARGQLTVVFPHEDAVVSVHAALGNMQAELNLIWEHLLPAFGAKALAENPSALSALRTQCATLMLPLGDPAREVFEAFDTASVEKTPDGWNLKKDGRTLHVGSGAWRVTTWKYTDDLVEPLFVNCGTHEIAANGRLLADGSLEVTWQRLGGVYHGSFVVSEKKF